MADLISRNHLDGVIRAEISKIENRMFQASKEDDYVTELLCHTISQVYRRFEQIVLDEPAVKGEPEKRDKGEWFWLSSTGNRTLCEMTFACNKCGHKVIKYGDRPWERFCPSCGADMRKES